MYLNSSGLFTQIFWLGSFPSDYSGLTKQLCPKFFSVAFSHTQIHQSQHKNSIRNLWLKSLLDMRTVLFIIESQNHRMKTLDRTFKDCLVQPFHHGPGHLPLIQGVWSPIPSGLNISNEEAITAFLGNLLQCCHTHCKKFILYSQYKPIFFQIKTISPCPVTKGPGKKKNVSPTVLRSQ